MGSKKADIVVCLGWLFEWFEVVCCEQREICVFVLFEIKVLLVQEKKIKFTGDCASESLSFH
jgi:hypothetical protein